MAGDFNRVILVGNLTRDPIQKAIPSGASCAEFALAVNESRKVGDKWVDEPSYIDITVWGPLADRALEKLKTGTQVLIEGRLKQDRWETKDGKRSKVKVVGERMRLLARFKGEGDSGGRSSSSSYDESEYSSDNYYEPSHSSGGDDQIPF